MYSLPPSCLHDLVYIQNSISISQNALLEAWHKHGKNVSHEMFSQADFIIGNSAACYDMVSGIVDAIVGTSFFPAWLPDFPVA